MSRIVSMVAAQPGWLCILRNPEGGPDDRIPIALWALCESDDGNHTQFVAPICAESDDPILEVLDNGYVRGYEFNAGWVAAGADQPR